MKHELEQNIIKTLSGLLIERVEKDCNSRPSTGPLKIQLNGEPVITKVPIQRVEDEVGDIQVEVLSVPIRVEWADIPLDPIDLLKELPYVDGEILFSETSSVHEIQSDFDFSNLLQLRAKFEQENPGTPKRPFDVLVKEYEAAHPIAKAEGKDV